MFCILLHLLTLTWTRKENKLKLLLLWRRKLFDGTDNVTLIFSAMWVSPDTSQTLPHTRIPPHALCPPCHCIKKTFPIPHIVAIIVFNIFSIMSQCHMSQFYVMLSLSENNHFWEIHCHSGNFIFSSLLYMVMGPGHLHSWVTILLSSLVISSWRSHITGILFVSGSYSGACEVMLHHTCTTLPHPCLFHTSSLCLRSHSSCKISPDWPGPF